VNSFATLYSKVLQPIENQSIASFKDWLFPIFLWIIGRRLITGHHGAVRCEGQEKMRRDKRGESCPSVAMPRHGIPDASHVGAPGVRWRVVVWVQLALLHVKGASSRQGQAALVRRP
jgi:hypothetical protein